MKVFLKPLKRQWGQSQHHHYQICCVAHSLTKVLLPLFRHVTHNCGCRWRAIKLKMLLQALKTQVTIKNTQPSPRNEALTSAHNRLKALHDSVCVFTVNQWLLTVRSPLFCLFHGDLLKS